MAKIAETYQAGDTSNLSIEQLYLIMLDMYKDLAIAINKKPDIHKRTTNGLVSDVFLSDGDININTNTLKVEMLTQHTTTTAVNWTTLS